MGELDKLLREIGVDNLSNNIGISSTNAIPTSAEDLLNMVSFTPSLRMKVIACLILVLFVSLALIRTGSSFARSIGFVFLFISLGAIILFILNL